MNYRDTDLRNILKHYVNRSTQDEIEYIQRQKKFGIRLCDRVSHQSSNDGKDGLVIETQLSSTNISSESSGNRNSTLLRTDISRDQSRSSVSNSDYYIKELHVAHVGKSKSLDESQINRVCDIHETYLTTVVGTRNEPFETVHKAVIEHCDSGRQLLQQDSFVRDTTTRPSSYHSLPGRIMNSLSLPSVDESNIVSRKKSNKMKSWRSIFPPYKKNKKSHADLSDIDQMARQRVVGSKEITVQSKTIGSPLSLQRDLPFKSYKIGEPLQPMKKKKRIPYFLRSMLSPGHSVTRSGVCTVKRSINNNDNARPFHKEYSTKDLDQESVNRIVATLVKDKDEEDFSYSTYGRENDNSTDPRSRHKSGPAKTDTDLHFNMSISDPVTRRKSVPTYACDCDSLRYDLLAKGINSIVHGTKIEELTKEFKSFDKSTFHFKSCPFNSPEFSLKKDSSESGSTRSQMSLYQSCEHCNDVDDQLHPAISVHLLPLITKLEEGDEINFNDDHLSYFLSVRCYKQFEKGIREAIGMKCSILSLAHLHYVTRRIVRHIGDPNKDNNEHIRKIMHYAEKFCAENFSRNIEVHGSMEEFLKHRTRYEVD